MVVEVLDSNTLVVIHFECLKKSWLPFANQGTNLVKDGMLQIHCSGNGWKLKTYHNLLQPKF
jgi:hypothetical protein